MMYKRLSKVDSVDIQTNKPHIDPRVRFFKMRAKRFR
jgi:hypothetical protein